MAASVDDTGGVSRNCGTGELHRHYRRTTAPPCRHDGSARCRCS